MINQWQIRPDDDVRREQKSATVEVSAEALLSLLLAPEGMSIGDVSWNGRVITLTVFHPALETVDEGAVLPILYPNYESIRQTVNADWGDELGRVTP